MKKFAAAFFAVIMLVVLLTGCTSRDENLVGTWVWEDNPAFVTTFNADGTGTHAVSWGFGTTFRWATPGNNIRWNYPNHPNMDTPYRISGNALYMTMDDGTVYRYIRN